MKVAISNLGCSKNQVDGEYIIGSLINSGFLYTKNFKEADVIIVNSCAFIEDARKETVNTVKKLAINKLKGNCKTLIVTGCYSQRYKPEDLKNTMPDVDCFINLKNAGKIGSIINKILYDKSCNYSKILNRFRLESNYSAYLKISDGCNNRCTYCAIPIIRGAYKERPVQSIIDEAKTLEQSGVKELILVAQDTTMYGYNNGKTKLPVLLKALLKETSIPWIRIMYTHPAHWSDNLIDIIAGESRICSYVDLPIQHISDHVLNCMGRNVNAETIYNLIYKLRLKILDIIIRTTIMVGFPNETERDFKKLYSFIDKIKFDRLGIFKYSREKNTKSFSMKNQIPDATATERMNKIIRLQENIMLTKNKEMNGKTVKVLTELGKSGNPLYPYWGRYYGDAPEVDGIVYLKGKNIKAGIFTDVKINKADKYDLYGEVI